MWEDFENFPLEILKALLSFLDEDVDEIIASSCFLGKTRGQKTLWELWDGKNLELECLRLAASQGIALHPTQPFGGGIWQGCRWQIVIPPLAPQGFCFFLRRHRWDLGLEAFQVTENHQQILDQIFIQGETVLICGPTGCGKTTLLVTMMARHAQSMRLLMLDEWAELPSLFPGWLPLVSQRQGGAFLVEVAMRLRPDKILWGELRRENFIHFRHLQSTGHGGIWGTFHGDSIEILESLAPQKPFWVVQLDRSTNSPHLWGIKKVD